MDYFAPQGTRLSWGPPRRHSSGDSRLRSYLGWFLGVSEVLNGKTKRYSASIWSFSPSRRHGKLFKTELEALLWCESEVVKQAHSPGRLEELRQSVAYTIRRMGMNPELLDVLISLKE
jgi:hypothetical protein